jgi:hypothetical protein
LNEDSPRLRLAIELVDSILEEGLGESTWRMNNESAYQELFKDRDDIVLHIDRILGKRNVMAAKKETAKAAKKTAPAKAPAKKAAPAPKKPPPPKAAPVKKKGASGPPSPELEAAIEEVQEQISEHEYASSSVTRSESIDFYRALANHCNERAQEIQQELDNEGEGDADDDTDSAGEPDFDGDDEDLSGDDE